MSKLKKVGVVGAGISGLATAYFLRKASRENGINLELSLLDGSDRPGGAIETERTDGYLLEWGPENFVAFKVQMLELLREIGLADEIIGSNDQWRRTYVVREKRLEALPDGMAFLAPVDIRSFWATPLISPRGKLRACLEPLVSRSRGELTVRDFLKRRLGAEFTERVAEPLVSAIYGGDIGRLSLSSALPETHEMEQRFGSLWKGMRRNRRRRQGPARSFFLSLRGGMSELVEGVLDQLKDVSLHWESGIARIEKRNQDYSLSGSGFEGLFDGLVLSTPAPASAALIDRICPQGAARLRRIPYTSTTIVYLAYKKAEFSHPLRGFGFVMPDQEADIMDACSWVSTKFEGRCPPDKVLLRCAIHDGRRTRTPDPGQTTAERVHEQLKRILHISCSPVFAKVKKAPGGMPQPTLGHAGRLQKLQQELQPHPGIFLANAFVGGIGLPSCVATAQKTARNVIDYLRERDG